MSVKPRVAIASRSECLAGGANVRFEASNDGVVPRWLAVELFIVCIGLLDIEVSVLFWFCRRVFFFFRSFAEAERPPETRHRAPSFFFIVSRCAVKNYRSAFK